MPLNTLIKGQVDSLEEVSKVIFHDNVTEASFTFSSVLAKSPIIVPSSWEGSTQTPVCLWKDKDPTPQYLHFDCTHGIHLQERRTF